mmetsp:Transcript_45687/g.111312  ORF Transcript_45687/g.111312 Transcript_45687/m.111312 type:complete len:829 (+) Transcript_45687:432-2918(+)
MQQADLGAGQNIMTTPEGAETAAAQQPLPKCFCKWSHCRTYQKAFREFKHPLFNGVVKLKFVKEDPRSMALKSSVDRTLHVEPGKRNEWREVDGEMQCRYYVARHHFTEALITQYLSNRRAWDWNQPLTMKQAKNLLWSLDRLDLYQSDDEDDDDRYIQAPNVPKEQVRELLKKLKAERTAAAEAAAASKSPNPADDVPPVSPPREASGPVPTSPPPMKKASDFASDMAAAANNTSTRTESTLATSTTDMQDTLRAYEEALVAKMGALGNAVPGVALAEKEEENVRLRQELNECQEQLSMLHNMVKQLKVDMDRTTVAPAAPAAPAAADVAPVPARQEPSPAGHVQQHHDAETDRATPKHSKNKKKTRKEEPSERDEDEVDIGDDEESSSEEDEEDESWSQERGRLPESEDEETISTYRDAQRRSGHSRPGSRHSVRRNSIHSKRSVRRDSVHSRRDSYHSRSRHSMRRQSMRGGSMDDGASVVSKQSLASVSPSIKSLPREIELMEDEEDQSFFDDSYRRHDDDARSVGSRSAASRASRKSFVSGQRSRGRNTRRPGPGSAGGKKKPPAAPGPGLPRADSGSRFSAAAVPREIDLSGDELDNPNETHANASNDILNVTEKQIVDPYGEKGVYTGALSKSTGMPNGKGKLKYEKEGRWYEGDWIHGRWTGFGRLSNGDGDFYEGGLKNDHKHGTGVMRFADGRVFEGEYIRGQMIQGKMTYQDGSVYGGSWVDGMRHGRGKCIFVDGSEYEGEFREGNFHGHGKMTWNDGGWYVGEWCDGEMHGRGKEIRPDGSLRHDGEWSRGQPIRSTNDARRRRGQQQPAGVEAI